MKDAAPPRPFLDVARSATGRLWTDRLDAAAAREALTIAQTLGLPDALARVLAGRGVALAEAPRFLDPTIRALMPDPDTLTDMPAATARLVRAVMAGERVAVFGDYDVDGATSAAILAGYLRALGLTVDIHIPDRLTEGYGPNIPAIAALADQGATLLVTVDCGTASHEPFAAARARGLDVVVFDHHQAPERLPEVVALVNPNRLDDVSGLGHLAACGVTFMGLVALNRHLRNIGQLPDPAPDLMASLDLVALGTVADVVPLKGLNRAFVRQGLRIMAEGRRPGLAALASVAGLKESPRPYHLGFLLGPRINAGGRIGDAALGSRLLLTDDPVAGLRMAGDLDRLNRERQVIEQAMLAEAEAAALRQTGIDDAGAPVLLTASDSWHPGVVGLVAARLKERFRRPAFAFAVDAETGLATGSGRSLSGVDLGRAVRAAVEAGIAVKGGGHAMAAGATVPAVQLDAFRDTLTAALATAVAAARATDRLSIDVAMTAAAATADLVEAMDQAGPFGQGNPEPIVAVPGHTLADVMAAGEHHLRFRLRSDNGETLKGVAFRAQGQPLGEALHRLRGQKVHAAGTLLIDRWGGMPTVELRLIDIAPFGQPVR
jgi:single-stranded-DNA-specific exonuclease